MKLNIFSAVLINTVLALSGCEKLHDEARKAEPSAIQLIEAPSGDYRIDPTHASILVRIGHQGFSQYTFRFDRFSAKLEFDAKRPLASSVTAQVDITSVNTDSADFDLEIAEFLGAPDNGTASFVSTTLERTSLNSAYVTGDLTLRGMKKPAAFLVTLNRAGTDMFGRPRIGLSISGLIKRSKYGVANDLPPDDVSNDVEIQIEIELIPDD